jgi:hypothetical protein
VFLPGIIFINIFTHSFFTQKTKKLLVFENEFHHAFSYKNFAGRAIRKSHLAVPVAIHKSQIAVRKKASKNPHIKLLMKLTPDHN